MAKSAFAAAFVALLAHSALQAAASEESCSDLAEDAHLDGASGDATNAANGTEMRVVCEMGCWDTEDEACHEGLTQNECAEIYGHVEWAAKCACRRITLTTAIVCYDGCWSTENEVCEDQLTEDECARSAADGVALEWAAKCKCESKQIIAGTGEVFSNSANSKGGQVNLYFSIPAFVVLFRESLEVVIVLAIIIQFLTKAHNKGQITDEQFRQLKREVYVGAGAGFIMCLIMGVGFIALASMARGLFRCDGLLVFDGVIMLITTFVLTFLALNFYKMIHTQEAHELKMANELNATIRAVNASGQGSDNGFAKKHAFLVFAFSTGLREGMESIIFLIGVISDFKDPSYISSLPLPMISALILSRIVGCIFFQGTKKMRVDHFMRFCAILLLFIAAGFFSSSMHKWQELELFGTWSPRAARPWQNEMVFDASDCCNDKTNRFFVLMRALLGWQDQPTPLEFFAYALYWVVAPIVGVVLVQRAKKGMEKRLAELRRAYQESESQESTKEDGASVSANQAQESEGPGGPGAPVENKEVNA